MKKLKYEIIEVKPKCEVPGCTNDADVTVRFEEGPSKGTLVNVCAAHCEPAA